MRLFVAVFPPREVRDELAASARRLEIPDDARFTRPKNIHLTLKFLGEVPEDSTRAIHVALARIAQEHAPFELSPSGFGGFPSNEKARVLWAGLSGEVEKLRSLANAVEESLTPLGFDPERRGFSPHLTLARAKRPVTLNLSQGNKKEEPPAASFRVEEITLVHSRTKREGAVYTTLKVYPLAKS